MDEVTRVLARCRLCVHLSADEMRTLTGRGVVRRVQAGARVAGVDEIAVLIAGEAEIRHETPGGLAWTTRAGPAAVLNEQAFLGGTAALEKAEARGPVVAFALGRAAFLELCDAGDPAAAKLARAIASAGAADGGAFGGFASFKRGVLEHWDD